MIERVEWQIGTQPLFVSCLFVVLQLSCDVHLAVKGQTAKASLKLSEIFDIQPNKFSLESKGMKFVTVTFSPQAIQVTF